MSRKGFTVAAGLAALSMAAAPLAAARMVPASIGSEPVQTTWSESGATAHQHRGHRWGRGWDRHRHRNRVDAGDVIAGVLILGGIAAVVDAVRDNRERDVREREVREGDWRNRDWRDTDWPDHDDHRAAERTEQYPRERAGEAYRDNSGLDNAVRVCADEVEREAQVGAVDRAERTMSGWEVRGTLTDGAGFVCRIGQDGRADVDYSLRRDRPVFENDRRD